MSMSLHYIATRLSEDIDKPIEIVAATDAGTLRPIPVSEVEALRLIGELAKYLSVLRSSQSGHAISTGQPQCSHCGRGPS